MNKKYYKEIDICKGVLAIFVIVGHVFLQTEVENIKLQAILNIIGGGIYSFHMQCFFLISGFLSCGILELTDYQEKLKYLLKKGKRLIIPYFTMGLIYFPLRILMQKYARNEYDVNDFWKIIIGNNPDSALWFLYVLFVIIILFVLFANIRNLKFITFITFLLYVISLYLKFDFSLLNNLFKYSFFFSAGIYINKYYYNFSNKFLLKRYLLLYILLFLLTYYAQINYGFSLLELSSCVFGILSTFTFSKLVNLSLERDNFLILIGRYCMDIYIFSEPIKVIIRIISNRLGFNGCLTIVFCSLGAILIPIVISKYIVRKSKALSLLFLGI